MPPLPRRRLVLAALALLVACARTPAGWSRVSATDFASELSAPLPPGGPLRVIVDVREPELFAQSHIPGAINLPWPDAKTRAPAELDSAAMIVLVCHGGPMGDELAAILAGRGFRHVRNVAGGMNAWRGPVATGR